MRIGLSTLHKSILGTTSIYLVTAVQGARRGTSAGRPTTKGKAGSRYRYAYIVYQGRLKGRYRVARVGRHAGPANPICHESLKPLGRFNLKYTSI